MDCETVLRRTVKHYLFLSFYDRPWKESHVGTGIKAPLPPARGMLFSPPFNLKKVGYCN